MISGQRIGIKRKELKDLRIAALLHDIGKISIPKSILNKQGPLTKDEFEIVKKHPIYSAEIIDNFEELSHLSEYILHHHERMDGSGYPSRLKGYEIPLFCRIIAIADIFEALIGERPYRDPISPEDAVRLMEREMSVDPFILKILKENMPYILRHLKLVSSMDTTEPFAEEPAVALKTM